MFTFLWAPPPRLRARLRLLVQSLADLNDSLTKANPRRRRRLGSLRGAPEDTDTEGN